jgi:cytochrome c-type biogenesis protein CcmH
VLRLLVLLVLALPAPAGAQDESALAVESRLLAPCCWNQTLDVHASPLADELRGEIRRRLDAGETGAAIEDDLAARYGERIRALPRGEDPLRPLGPVLAVVLATLAALLITLGRRWASRSTPPPPLVGRAPDALDARLDDELGRFEE